MDISRKQSKKKKYGRGVVVWASDPFKDTKCEETTRPWVLISNRSHPFTYQWIAMAITSKKHEKSIPITDDDWIRGQLETQSYVSPWSVATISSEDIWSYVGTLNDDFVNKLKEQLDGFIISNHQR